MPETRFYYRVRPLHGPASEPVDVRLADVAYPEMSNVDVAWADPRRLPGAAPGAHPYTAPPPRPRRTP